MKEATNPRRDWMQIFAIYGVGELRTLILFLLPFTLSTILSILSIFYFSNIISLFAIPFFDHFLVIFICICALISLYLLFYISNIFYSSLSLYRSMCEKMVACVDDWSTVHNALDVGCGRGVLLNVVAMEIKKAGSLGAVVGVDSKEVAVSALRTSVAEGVEKYVTCREGDSRELPFPDGYFDVVVSALHLSRIGKETKERARSSKSTAEAEREKAMEEMVRVLKSGGTGVIWDLVLVPQYAKIFRGMGMEDVKVSEQIRAYMVSSQIVTFRKPKRREMESDQDDEVVGQQYSLRQRVNIN